MRKEEDRMALFFKLFSAFFVALCLLQQGTGRVTKSGCGTDSISVNQARTGNIVEGNPEYEVMMSNQCGCPQSEVVVSCYGLSSLEPVDPDAIKPIDGTNHCIVNGGRVMVQGSAVRFKYAWKTPQDFTMVSSHLGC